MHSHKTHPHIITYNKLMFTNMYYNGIWLLLIALSCVFLHDCLGSLRGRIRCETLYKPITYYCATASSSSSPGHKINNIRNYCIPISSSKNLIIFSTSKSSISILLHIGTCCRYKYYGCNDKFEVLFRRVQNHDVILEIYLLKLL